MSLRARIRHFARPTAFTAALTALLVPAVAGPATADAAKRTKRYPVVTSVRPMNPKVGDTIVLRGRNFNRGKNKNTVVFKRDGARAVFVKTTLATAKQIRVVVPDTLRPFLPDNTSARFRLRVLSQRFSKTFTKNAASPTVTALPKPAGSTGGSTGGTTTGGGGTTSDVPAPVKICHGDDDGDMLDAALENELGLDACNPDTDGDGVPDGYEYQSALDLNDDEYQEANQALPYPGKRPYPNPLFKDADVDYDGDGLWMDAEYRLWNRYGARPTSVLPDPSYRLYYSDGEQYSLSTRAGGTGRRTPSQPAATYTKSAQFLAWAGANGYNPVRISKAAPWYDESNKVSFDIRDADHSGSVTGSEDLADLDGDGYISDNERDEDADGLTNIDELRSAMQPGYWESCYAATGELPYPVKYSGTDLTDPDTDGDGIRDGADDQDHDDIPNVMELSRTAASGGFADWFASSGKCTVDSRLKSGPDINGDGSPDWVVLHPDSAYGRVNPFNPCLPYTWSRTCPKGIEFGTAYAPFDFSPWYALQ